MKRFLVGLIATILVAFPVLGNAQLVNVDRTGRTQWYLDDTALWFGSTPDDKLSYNTVQTPDALTLGIDATSRQLILMDMADVGTDAAVAQAAYPSMTIMSADLSKYITLGHDGTNGVIDVSSGAVSFPDGIIAPVIATSPFTVTDTDEGAEGSIGEYYQVSTTPAANDEVGIQRFSGMDDGGNKTIYSSVIGLLVDPTDGAEIGGILFYGQNGTGAQALAGSAYHNGSYGIMVAGDNAAAGAFESEGDFDVILRTGNSATSQLAITDGADGKMQLYPDGDGVVEIYNNSADNVGAVQEFYQRSASPAADDAVGVVFFNGDDDATNKTLYGQVAGVIVSPTDGSEEGGVAIFSGLANGALQSVPDLMVMPGALVSTFVSDGTDGAVLNLTQVSASPIMNDAVGSIQFRGMNDGATEVSYGSVMGSIFDPTGGAEVGQVSIRLANGTGAQHNAVTFMHDGSYGTVAAGDGAAEGLVTSFGSQDLIIATGNPTTGSLTLENGANGSLIWEPNAVGAFEYVVTDDGASGAEIIMTLDSASPAALDVLGSILATGRDNAANEQDYGALAFAILDPTSGTESAGFAVSLQNGTGAFPTVEQFVVNGLSGSIGVTREADAAEGAAITLTQLSASPAINDEVGFVKFTGLDDGAGAVEYATIKGIIDSPTDAAEIGHISFYSQNGTGDFPLSASIGHNGSYGFIALGDGAAAGLVKSSGDFDLIIETGNAVSSSMTITDGADGDITLDVNGNGVFTDGTFSVDDGAFTGVASIVATGDITSSDAGDIGWSIVAGANTACSTTCTFACVAGQDADAANVLVDCDDAASDLCICAGGS